MIVVDTNVIAYLHLPGEYTAEARGAFARDAVWAAPMLWRSELRNVLALYVRQRHLTLAQAMDIQTVAESILAGREYSVRSARVIELAAASGCSAYDCEFVALAQALGVPLVTSDRQLLQSFPETAHALAVFASGA
jgi:predicted nucleic acid-binding protein